jgi:hypothetical protein
VQTFYGIWDDGGRVYGGGSYVVPTRGNPDNPDNLGNLLEQQFEATALVEEAGGGTTVSLGRTSTNHAIDWSNGLRGWYIDLKLENVVAEGERVVVAPQLRGSRVVFVSMIPEDCCSSGGLSWINALDFKDGSRLAYTPFDYNLDGGFGADDKLSIVDDAGDTSKVVGSSIRILTDGGTGVYSAPSQLGLGGGQMQSIVSDSEGDLILLRESTALEWRNWVQLKYLPCTADFLSARRREAPPAQRKDCPTRSPPRLRDLHHDQSPASPPPKPVNRHLPKRFHADRTADHGRHRRHPGRHRLSQLHQSGRQGAPCRDGGGTDVAGGVYGASLYRERLLQPRHRHGL